MRAFLDSLLGSFLTPGGLIVLGALDSSLIFFLPLGIDFAVVILAARRNELFWLYALLAAAGSLAGAAVTYWIGRAAGDRGLARLVPAPRLERIKRRVNHQAAVHVALLGLIPPPFPFTAFVLASGAVAANPWKFFGVLGGIRLLRFGVEAGLAARYGRRILSWMDSLVFEVVVGALIVAAVGGTIVSAVAVYRGAASRRPSVAE